MLIGLGKMIKKVTAIVGSLLTTRILGSTTVQVPGGSGYYTTMVGSQAQGFVAVANGVGIMYSVDGVVWTKALASGGNFTFTKYLNGKFFVGQMMNLTWVSDNGVDWEQNYNIPLSANTIEYQQGYYLVVQPAGYGMNIYKSTDLSTWTGTQTGYGSYRDIIWDNGVWNILAELQQYNTATSQWEQSAKLYSSIDGSNWYEDIFYPATPIINQEYKYFIGIAAKNGHVVVPEYYGNMFYGRYNGTWTENALTLDETVYNKQIHRISQVGSRLFITGQNVILTADTTSETLNFTENSAPTVGLFIEEPLVTAEGKIIFVNSNNLVNNESVAYSTWTDYGIYFEPSTTTGLMLYPNAQPWEQLYFRAARIAGSKVVATGLYASAYSSDGSTWFQSGLVDSNYDRLTTGIIDTLVETQVAIGNQGTVGAEILAPVDVYTVGVLKESVISNVTFKNNSDLLMTYDYGIYDADTEMTSTNILVDDAALSAGMIDDRAVNQTLVEGEKITVLPSSVDALEVKVYGTETNLPRYIGFGNYVSLYSTDGSTWTSTSIAGQYFSDVLYANGKFVAFEGYNYHVATSDDGVTWTLHQVDRIGSEQFANMNPHYFNNTYHLFGNESHIYSSDGTTWNKDWHGPGYSYYGGAFEINGKLVVVGDVFNVSTDGVTWTTYSNNLQLGLDDATQINGSLFAINNIDNAGVKEVQVYSSSNGYEWSLLSTFSTTTSCFNPAIVNGKIVILENTTDQVKVHTSTDGLNWTHTDITSLRYFATVFQKANNKIFASGQSASTFNRNVLYSSDGIVWNELNDAVDIYYVEYFPEISQYAVDTYSNTQGVSTFMTSDLVTGTHVYNNGTQRRASLSYFGATALN